MLAIGLDNIDGVGYEPADENNMIIKYTNGTKVALTIYDSTGSHGARNILGVLIAKGVRLKGDSITFFNAISQVTNETKGQFQVMNISVL